MICAFDPGSISVIATNLKMARINVVKRMRKQNSGRGKKPHRVEARDIALHLLEQVANRRH
jgi:hypothetical protein